MSEFRTTIRPRYGEVDSMGVVYHAHYLVYFDVGRTEYMRAAGTSYAELERRGYRLAVVDAGVRYLRSAHFDETLSLAVRVRHVGRASVGFEYRLDGSDGKTLATGQTRLGCLDENQRPVALPADTAACLRRGMESGPGPSEGA
ncbi:MAG: acyl-CoA thioesterase [Planctomycetota bacterium]|jgi:acyl-CoA thioester hydrolase